MQEMTTHSAKKVKLNTFYLLLPSAKMINTPGAKKG